MPSTANCVTEKPGQKQILRYYITILYAAYQSSTDYSSTYYVLRPANQS